MAKYNCSTMGKYMMLLKEDIKEALQGRVKGEAASKEECDRVILNTFDAAVYHLQDALAGSRALSRVMENHGCKPNAELMQEYIVAHEEEKRKCNDYKYEGEENDD